MTTTTMNIEAARYIIRRKGQNARERAIVGDALTLLGRAGYSDRDATMEAQRELSDVEISILMQARIAAGHRA